MDLSKKLEEIRQKPEHVRLRYVWAAVAVSMFFVFLIWIFSFGQNIKQAEKNEVFLPDFKSELESQKQNMPSIDNLMDTEMDASGYETSEEGALNNNEVSTEELP